MERGVDRRRGRKSPSRAQVSDVGQKGSPGRGGRGKGGRGFGRGSEASGWVPKTGGTMMGRGRKTGENEIRQTERSEARAGVAGKWAGERKESDSGNSSPEMSKKMELMRRVISARLDMAYESEEEIDGFLLGEEDTPLSDLSSRDCVLQLSTTHLPSTSSAETTLALSKLQVSVPLLAESSVGGGEWGSSCCAQFDDAGGQSEDGADQSEDVDRLVVKTPPGGGGLAGREESEDDGWNSDNSDFTSHFPSHSAVPTSNLPPYAIYEDDVWVDEARAVLARCKREDYRELQDLLRQMFSIHTDVYRLLLAFVARTGKARLSPKSLPRIALATFQKWLKEGRERGWGREGGEPEKLPQNPPILRDSHQEEVLVLMTRIHHNLTEDLSRVFQLHSVRRDLLVDLVHRLLAEGKRKEAVKYAWTFRLQSHFRLDEMLLPLIGLDKINLIENYIEGDQGLQEEFVMLLDTLCHSGGLARYAQRLGLKVDAPNSKLSSKQLFKLALRLVKMFNLQLSKFPGLASQRLVVCLHHLLRMRYLDGRSITEANMADLIAAAVSSHGPGLPQLLVRELVRLGEMEAAAHWALEYHVPTNTLPLEAQLLAMSGGPRRGREKNKEKEESQTECLQLSLPVDHIHFVSDTSSLRKCRSRLTQKGALIGVDAEWRLPICNGWDERMALLQLAVSEEVYLLDMLALPHAVSHSLLREFVHDVFCNRSTVKLGYSIAGDLDLLARSWPFAADILSSLARVVDLKILAAMVGNLSSPGHTPTLPSHPLLSRNPTGKRTPNPQKSSPDNPRSKNPPRQTKSDPPDPRGSEADEDPLEGDRSRGLSLLVQTELERPLDKSQQISDWEKRPLTPEQVRYAALDAHCLLQLYSVLTARGLAVDPHLNIEPCISPPRHLPLPHRSSRGQTI